MSKLPKRKLSRKGEKVMKEMGNEIISAASKYGQFKILFLSGQENLDIMRNSAPHFFQYAGESLFREVVMTLARLCDSADSVVRGVKVENLTFALLAKELPLPSQTRFLKKLGKLRKRFKVARIWRDKHLAHNDLEHALRTKKLPKLRYDRLEGCIKDASNLLNAVNRYKREIHTGYNMVVIPRGARMLLDHLDLARRAMEQGVHLAP